MILYPNRKTAMIATVALAVFIALTNGGPADAGKSPYTRARPNAVLFGTVAAPTKAPLNINAAGKPELGPLPVLSSAAKAAILNFKAGGPYVDATDFATRVCSRVPCGGPLIEDGVLQARDPLDSLRAIRSIDATAAPRGCCDARFDPIVRGADASDIAGFSTVAWGCEG